MNQRRARLRAGSTWLRSPLTLRGGVIPAQAKRLERRIVAGVRYDVTVEPAETSADPDVGPVSTTLEAADKDAALDLAEASYRRRHPRVGKLRSTVVRRHAPAKPGTNIHR